MKTSPKIGKKEVISTNIRRLQGKIKVEIRKLADIWQTDLPTNLHDVKQSYDICFQNLCRINFSQMTEIQVIFHDDNLTPCVSHT